MSGNHTAEPDDLIIAAIDAAEDITDPLEGLVERTIAHSGAPFVPEVLSRLVALKNEDRAAFEGLRARLKTAGCRVTELDDAIAKESGDERGEAPKQADVLISLAQGAKLFHSKDGTGFADVEVNGHRETCSLRGKPFKRWLARRCYEDTRGAPSSEGLQAALNVIEAKAIFDGPECDVYVRVGEFEGRIYIDLGDEAWRAIEIDTSGWRVVDNPPVRFRRTAGMRPLPVPVRAGSIEALRPFLNLKSNSDFVLVGAWLLACLRNRGPYPVIVLSGEQGSAKSTFTRVLRALTDPNTAPLRALPRGDRDLFIAANNAHVLAFDNVSKLPSWLSDTLCRLATGGGFATRALYTDTDETLFDASRPIVLNGIEDIVERPDLADRALLLTLEPIPEEHRRPEAEFWAAFDAEAPAILGALLDAMVEGLKRLPDTRLDTLPRMADFARWGTACETALGKPGTFLAAYRRNTDEAVEGIIDADPIAVAVRTLMATRTGWKGTSTELLPALSEVVPAGVVAAKEWPDSPRALSGRLRRAATFLRKIGVEIDFARTGKGRTRTISITTTVPPDEPGAQPSAPSAASASMPKTNPTSSFTAQAARTVTPNADGSGDAPTVRANPAETAPETAADGADANLPHETGHENTRISTWRQRV